MAILAERDARETVRGIAARWREESGHDAHLFERSSDGARVWRLDTLHGGLARELSIPPAHEG